MYYGFSDVSAINVIADNNNLFFFSSFFDRGFWKELKVVLKGSEIVLITVKIYWNVHI